MSATCWSAARWPAIPARRPTVSWPRSMTTARRSSPRPIPRAAARPIRSPRIRSMRKATRSSNTIRRAFWSWRRRSSSPGTAAVAGIRNSRFVHSAKPWPWSIKLEGSRRLGSRKVSLIHLDPADLSKIPPDVLVYGRNGVQAQPVEASQRELGIIVETTGKTREAAVLLASLLTHYLIHYGYPGRKATAGNIAYPLSPNLVSFEREDGTFGAIVPSGTRDPVFFENYPAIKAAVLKLIADEFPDALRTRPTRSPMRTPPIRSRCCGQSIAMPKGWPASRRRSTGSRGWSSPARVRCSISMRRTPMRGRSIISCRTRT